MVNLKINLLIYFHHERIFKVWNKFKEIIFAIRNCYLNYFALTSFYN